MQNFPKERKLNKEEEKIFALLNEDRVYFSFIDGVTLAIAAFDDTFGHNYSSVFKSVFIEKSDIPKWRIAQNCSISESTFFRYEKDIMDFIRNFHTNLALTEVAVTKKGD